MNVHHYKAQYIHGMNYEPMQLRRFAADLCKAENFISYNNFADAWLLSLNYN